MSSVVTLLMILVLVSSCAKSEVETSADDFLDACEASGYSDEKCTCRLEWAKDNVGLENLATTSEWLEASYRACAITPIAELDVEGENSYPDDLVAELSPWAVDQPERRKKNIVNAEQHGSKRISPWTEWKATHLARTMCVLQRSRRG